VKVAPLRQLVAEVLDAAFGFFERGPARRLVSSLVRNMIRHQSLHLASAMAFDLFLALVPLLALAGWFVSLVLQSDSTAMQTLSGWMNIAPTDVQRVINQHAERFSGRAVAPLALLGALWLGSGAFDTVLAAFERAAPSDPRPWWVRRGIAVLCVPCFLATLSLAAWLAIHATTGPERVLGLLGKLGLLAPDDYDVPQTVGIVSSGAIITLLIASFFRIGVRRDVPRRSIWPGTLLTLAIGSAASYGFATYAATIAQYAVYYGSLAAVAVLLAWLWLCSIALLVGAELNVHLEEQRMTESKRAPVPLWIQVDHGPTVSAKDDPAPSRPRGSD
jgi:membrane protein